MVQSGFGPPEDRMHPRDLPFTDGPVDDGADPASVPGAGVRAVDHLLLLIRGQVVSPEERPGLVEQVLGELGLDLEVRLGRGGIWCGPATVGRPTRPSASSS